MDADNVKSGAAEQSPHNPSRSFILNLTYLWSLTLLNRFDLLNGSSAGNLKNRVSLQWQWRYCCHFVRDIKIEMIKINLPANKSTWTNFIFVNLIFILINFHFQTWVFIRFESFVSKILNSFSPFLILRCSRVSGIPVLIKVNRIYLLRKSRD